jgi:hypothetical protein
MTESKPDALTSNVRAAFEDWLLKDHGRHWRPGSNGDYVFGPRSPHAGEYRDRTLQLLWTVWQAALSNAHETFEQQPVAWMTEDDPPRVASAWSREGMPELMKAAFCIPLYQRPAKKAAAETCEQQYVEIGMLIEIEDGEPPQHPNTIFVNWNEKRYALPAGTKIYAPAQKALEQRAALDARLEGRPMKPVDPDDISMHFTGE